jgi:hypothetical protein
LKRLSSEQGPPLVGTFQHSHRLIGQVHDMRLGILCPLFGDRPNSVREIELLPLQTSDFLSALSSECQKFNNSPISSADLSRAKDNLGELLVVQDPVSSNFLRGQWYAIRRGLIEDGSTHAPAQEGLDRLQSLISGDRSPALFDSRDEFDHISLGDFMNTPAGPGLSHLSAQQPGNFAAGAILGQMLSNERLQQIFDAICHHPSFCLPPLGRRIAPVKLGCEHLCAATRA